MLRIFAIIHLFFVLSACAQTQHTVVFGDSLSDEGRLYQATHEQFPPAPFYAGRFSDGPVWTEHLLGTRENFAFSGAKSDYGNLLSSKLGPVVDNTGLQAQIDDYLANHHSHQHTTYYINIGANDFLALNNTAAHAVEQPVAETVGNILDAAIRLREAGAERVILIGLPDLSIIPFAAGLAPSEQLAMRLISQTFNTLLENKSNRLGFEYFDLEGMVSSIMSNAQHHGLTNLTEACFDEINHIVCSNPEQYFYWDDKHPTTVIHEIFAERVG